MTYDLLTVEQQLAILTRRKLELEAEHYAQQVEHDLAVALGKLDVIENTKKRMTEFEQAIESLTAQISLLPSTPPA